MQDKINEIKEWDELEELWTKDSAERFFLQAEGKLKPENVSQITLDLNKWIYMIN